MSGEVTPGPGGDREVVPSPGPVTCGAELVVLAEAAQVRLFRLTGAFLLVGCVLALAFGSQSSRDPGLATALTALVGGALAVLVVARPLGAYLALRAGRALRIVLVAAVCCALLVGGIDGPSWWVALGLVLVLSTVSSTAFAMLAAAVVAGAYAGGSVLAGGSLGRHGIDAGVVAGASGLLLYALVVRVVTEGFARVLLMLHRSQAATARGLPGTPLVPIRADGAPWSPPAGEEPAARAAGTTAASSVVVAATPGDVEGRPGRSARLTVRQLEVALLARDGLLQAEIAEALAISVTQVERHLRQGRQRVGAATVGELLAVLVQDGIIGPPPQDVEATAAA